MTTLAVSRFVCCVCLALMELICCSNSLHVNVFSVLQSAVFFFVAILLEVAVVLIQGRENVVRLADGISSMTAGMFMMLTA